MKKTTVFIMRVTVMLLLSVCLAQLTACGHDGNTTTDNPKPSVNSADASDRVELFSTTAGTTFALGKPIYSKDGQYQLILSSSGKGIRLNEYFDLVVEVRSSVGQAIQHPLELEFDAGMRAHNHGMNTRPVIRAMGNGLFRIEQLLLHMPGLWSFDFRVRRGMISDHAGVVLELWP